MAVVRIPVMVEVEVDPSTGKPDLPEAISLLSSVDGTRATLVLDCEARGRVLGRQDASVAAWAHHTTHEPGGGDVVVGTSPGAHALTHAIGGSDPVSPASIGAAYLTQLAAEVADRAAADAAEAAVRAAADRANQEYAVAMAVALGAP
jgi:hypothetical protein